MRDIADLAVGHAVNILMKDSEEGQISVEATILHAGESGLVIEYKVPTLRDVVVTPEYESGVISIIPYRLINAIELDPVEARGFKESLEIRRSR